MKRWLGNKLIKLAYQIEPKLNAELIQWINELLVKQAEITAEQCLTEYRKQAACLAARQ